MTEQELPIIKLNSYGFNFGAAKVTRACSFEKTGAVVILLETPKQSIQIYVTKTGKVRISDDRGEWKAPNK